MVLSVPNIMCEECREKIQNALKERGVVGEINLRFKTVTVSDEDEEKAREAISSVGYQVI